MLRAFGAFLVLFSLLSLLVHLQALGSIFAIAALCFFAVEPVMAQFERTPRASRMRGEPLP
ncbi:MAG TPA: hypothetical protein VFL34_04070 [Candidatus Sulfotelmatobacter sp.]|nr:hypothetical protein [Candidatus Sulfotelmatobacter sp.]